MHPRRLAVRLKLIKQRASAPDGPVRGHGILGFPNSRWNYTISADADIAIARCPKCFRAFSDYEEPAVVPCYRCREEQDLCELGVDLVPEVVVPTSVTVDMEEGAGCSSGCSRGDVGVQ